MDLVLVVPPVPNIDSDGRRVTSSARLGIAYLAAYARAKGHEVITINAPSSGLSVADVISRIMSLRPAAAGITMSFQHLDLLPGVELVRGLRTAGYKGHITAGGYTPTFEWQTILERVPEIDSVVVGEGEVTLEELLRAVKAGTPVESVSGLALMKTGKPELTAPRPLIDDLDTVPFPLRDPGDMNGIASISTSRGCYGRCSFCSVRTFYQAGTGRPWRGRSPQNVVDEVVLLHGQFGCNQFLFVDDNFIGPGSRGRERARAIADELIARRLQIKFGIACRANDVDLALFTRLKQAGLRTVFIGIESGTQRQLNMYGKAVTIDENKRALHILRQLGLKMDAGFIMFDPDVTLEELEANLHFLRETQLYRCESGLYNQLVHVYPFSRYRDP